MYQALECCAQDAIGPGGSWAAAMDSGLVNNLGKCLHRSCCTAQAWLVKQTRQHRSLHVTRDFPFHPGAHDCAKWPSIWHDFRQISQVQL